MQYSSQLQCGWAGANTAFRSVICWVSISTAIAVFFGLRYESTRTMFWCMLTYMISAIAMISVLTLDANSVRVGASYCKNKAALGAGFTVDCYSMHNVSLCAAEGGAVLLLWCAYLSTKGLYKVFRSKGAGGSAARPRRMQDQEEHDVDDSAL